MEYIIKNIYNNRFEEQLNQIMEKEKIYRNCEITLSKMAMKLEIEPHHLSAYLNKKLKQNFNTYINSYRIQEAIYLLKNEVEISITTIAYEVGFSSISQFYRAFKKFVGQRPTAYRYSSIDRAAGD
jgi:AraC-like DNA-binding protein